MMLIKGDTVYQSLSFFAEQNLDAPWADALCSRTKLLTCTNSKLHQADMSTPTADNCGMSVRIVASVGCSEINISVLKSCRLRGGRSSPKQQG